MQVRFFLVNQSTFCNIISADILPGYKTGHSMITIQISLHSNKRGRGFWKINTSLLNDIEYVNKIKAIIKETSDEHGKDDSVNPNLLWGMVKMKVREESLKCGASKKSEISRKEEEIERSIAKLEKCLGEKYVDEYQKQKVWSDLETKKRELEVIIEHRTKGAIVRSKSQWYNEGEKNNKYFLNLEKRHFKQGTITQLKVNTDSDDRVCSDKEILHECEAFVKIFTAPKKRHISRNTRPPLKYEEFLSNFLENPKPSRPVYKKLVSKKSELPISSQQKWLEDINITINWKTAYQLSFQCTKSTKLIAFNFKFLHRRLLTNNFLKRIGLVNSEKCQRETETLVHLLWGCPKIQSFWIDLSLWLQYAKYLRNKRS